MYSSLPSQGFKCLEPNYTHSKVVKMTIITIRQRQVYNQNKSERDSDIASRFKTVLKYLQ